MTAPLSVSGGNVPANLTRPSVTVDAASVTVTGTTAPGATVDVAVTGTAPGAAAPATTITTVTADSSGAFSAPVSLQPGTDSVEVAATAGGATNEAIFTVTDLFVPGTVVLSAAPAPGGGNGPGTYAYPTATNSDGSPVFAPDSFRLNGLTVIDSGSHGHVPGRDREPAAHVRVAARRAAHRPVHPRAVGQRARRARLQSTAAAGAWNYSIAPADAWNQLIEVDGFGTDDWVTPGQRHLRAVRVVQPRHPAGLGGPARADRVRRDTGAGHDHGADVGAGHPGLGLDLHGDAHRAGRVRQRRRPHVHRDAGRVHVRRLLGGRGRRAVAARGLRGQPGRRCRS